MLAYLPALVSALLAWSLGAGVLSEQTPTQLPEENRRIIERHDERMAAISRELENIDGKLARLEYYILGIFLTTGGVGALVGHRELRSRKDEKDAAE